MGETLMACIQLYAIAIALTDQEWNKVCLHNGLCKIQGTTVLANRGQSNKRRKRQSME
jgi:hypothetical protein